MLTNWLAGGAVQWLLTLGGIILVDIALSGDNALVIGAAASRLPQRQRVMALLWGGVAAAILRILLTGVATELLLIPLLQTAGAVVILYIAIHLLTPEKEGAGAARHASDRLLPAVFSIFVADLTMSTDNVLAIGALAHGDLPLLVIGLLVSIALLLLASALVAQIITRFWWLTDLTALVLAYLAAQLVIQDPIVSRFADLSGVRATALTIGFVVAVGTVALAYRLSQARKRRRAVAVGAGAPSEQDADADALSVAVRAADDVAEAPDRPERIESDRTPR